MNGLYYLAKSPGSPDWCAQMARVEASDLGRMKARDLKGVGARNLKGVEAREVREVREGLERVVRGVDGVQFQIVLQPRLKAESGGNRI